MRRLLALACVLLPLAGCITLNSRSEYRDVQVDDLKLWSESPLARRGIVMLSGDLNMVAAGSICARLLTLDAMPEVARVTLLINSSFGSAFSARSVVNCIRALGKPVDVVNVGYCWNGACLIHQAATGRRLAQPDTVFAIASSTSESTDKEVLRWLEQEDERAAKALRARSRLPDAWFPLRTSPRIFTAEQALEHGFIDAVLAPRAP